MSIAKISVLQTLSYYTHCWLLPGVTDY